eukprot:1393485-Amorphochlora_amoeboformis.AAC.1
MPFSGGYVVYSHSFAPSNDGLIPTSNKALVGGHRHGAPEVTNQGEAEKIRKKKRYSEISYIDIQRIPKWLPTRLRAKNGKTQGPT